MKTENEYFSMKKKLKAREIILINICIWPLTVLQTKKFNQNSACFHLGQKNILIFLL